MKALSKFKNASPAVKASMALLLANMILKGLSMVSGPIFTRMMSPDEYGIVSTFISWQSILGVIITFNLASGVFNNGMLEFKNDRDSFQFSLIIVSCCSTIVWSIIYFLFYNEISGLADLPNILMIFMLIYFFFTPAYQYWNGRQRYEYKYKLLFVIVVGMSVLSVGLGIFMVSTAQSGSKGIFKVIATESVYIIAGLVFLVYIAIKAKFKFRWEYIKFALKFNVPLIPHYLSMYALSQSDRIMITKLDCIDNTAIYSVAYTVAAVINIFWQSVEASLSPWIYESLAADKKKDVKKVVNLVLLLFSVLCILSTLFSPEIMGVLAPSTYHSGIYVIPVVSVGVFFTAVYSIYMRIELYYKQTKFSMVATSIAAILNVVLNYIFIPMFGFVAAGYTTMFCYMILYLLHLLNVKHMGYASVLDNKTIAIISFFTIICALFIIFMYEFTILRYIAILAICIVAFIFRKKIIYLFKFIKNKK